VRLEGGKSLDADGAETVTAAYGAMGP
jgi:hypothetical protein